MPVQSACAIARCSWTAFYRTPAIATEPKQADTDAHIITALQTIAAQHGRWGFLKLFDRLRALQQFQHHKRVRHVHCALRLNQMRRTKKRLSKRDVLPLATPARVNGTWEMDCMGDSLYT